MIGHPLVRYTAAKLARAVFVVWAAYTLSFVLLYLLPVNAVDLLFDPADLPTIPAATKAAVAASYGFDKPPPVQYLQRLLAALHGGFGVSVQSGKPVWTAIAEVLPSTVVLAACALALAVVLAFGIAFAALSTRRRGLAGLVEGLPPAAVSVPVFLIGLLLIQVLSFQLGWFPPLGQNGLAALVLPMVTLAIPVSGPIAQLLVSNFSSEMVSAYVTTAVASGATRRQVLVHEVFRNASLPALTIAGTTLGNLVAGAVIVETVYSRSGLGRLTETAVSTKDIPVVQAIVVLTAAVFAVVNLGVDLIYPILDPRLRARILTA